MNLCQHTHFVTTRVTGLGNTSGENGALNLDDALAKFAQRSAVGVPPTQSMQTGIFLIIDETSELQVRLLPAEMIVRITRQVMSTPAEQGRPDPQLDIKTFITH